MITAQELMEQLNNDPEYVKTWAEKERKVKARSALLHDDEMPLLKDLKSVGIEINSLWDLVNTSEPYPEAIEILLNHLCLNYLPNNKEAIVRSLIVKEAKGVAVEKLASEFKKSSDKTPSGYRWIIAYAFTVVLDKENVPVAEELLSLTEDEGVKKELRKAINKFKKKTTRKKSAAD
jgi:hypothetical protein